MTAPHSDRDHSGDPFALPFWPPAHRHAIETGQQQPHNSGRVGCNHAGGICSDFDGYKRRAESAESVARGQQQVIEAQRAKLDAVRRLRDELPDKGWVGPWVHAMNIRDRLDEILDAAPNETKDQP